MYTVINDVFFNPIALTYVRLKKKKKILGSQKVLFIDSLPGFLQKYLGCRQRTSS